MRSKRPDWDTYFMMVAAVASTRSTCLRRQVGAVIARDMQIISTGYNGAPRNVRDCLEIGCLREAMGIPSGQRHELCRGLHAEQNVIIQAAIHGISLDGAEIYCTHQPCFICTKMLVNCGVTAVTYASPYPDPMSEEMFAEAGVDVRLYEPRAAGTDPEEALCACRAGN